MTTTIESQVGSIRSLDLDELNRRFETAHPQEVLSWCLNNIPTGLVQTSAFSVDDMVITDILYRQFQPVQPVPVIFLDTLHHFPQTLELVAEAADRYALSLKTYQVSEVNTREAFAAQYGAALWDTNITQFHYLTKIEPLQRGLAKLNATAWITGRRRDQAVTRANLLIFEWDQQQRLKVNPLANWTRSQSWSYAMAHSMIYNPLHDRGYASIGDEPLTTPVAEGEDERSGRWRGMGKTECGIHL